MKESTKINHPMFWEVLGMTAIFLFGISMGFAVTKLYEITQTEQNKVLSEIDYPNCSGLSLSETSACLKQDLNEWFFYNLSNVNRELNLSELKKIGGVCIHASRFYLNNFINLGFNAKFIDISGEDVGHEAVIAWTKNLSDGTYCIADQKSAACFNLGEVNMTLYKELTEK